MMMKKQCVPICPPANLVVSISPGYFAAVAAVFIVSATAAVATATMKNVLNHAVKHARKSLKIKS